MKHSPKLASLLAFWSMHGLTFAKTSYTDTSSTGLWFSDRWNNTDNTAPYTSAFQHDHDVIFDSGTYTFSGMGTTHAVDVGGITLNTGANVTFTGNSGVFSTGGTVSTFDIASSAVLNFGTQAFDATAGTGFIKNGAGVLQISGGTYSGGFTLNAGAVVSRGLNSFGQGLTNTLTINGGIIASSASRTFDTTYFGGGILVGGNVQFGSLGSAISGSGSGSTLWFDNDVSLGSGNRTFTVGNNAVHTFTGVISNTSGGLTFAATSGLNASSTTSTAFSITNLANTFTGDITITGGRVNFSGDGSLGNANNDVIVDGGVFSTASNTSYTVSSERIISLGDGAGSAINTQGTSILTVTNGLVNKTGETGNLVKQGAGTLSLIGANAYTGNTTISAGTLRIDGSSSLGSGNYSGNISIATGSQLLYQSMASQNLSGTISGSGSVVISLGTLRLSGANSLTGAYTVKNGGVLNLTNNSSLNGASTLTLEEGSTIDNSSNGGISIGSNATKSITGSVTYLGSGNQTLTMGGGATSLTGVGGSVQFNVVSGELAFSSSTTSSGVSLEKDGLGTLTFSNVQSNALNGTTSINQGTLRIVRDGSLGSNLISFDVQAGATLSLDGNLSWNGDYILRNNSQLIRQTNTVISANATYAANRTLTSADGLTNGKHTIQSGVTITATSDLFGSTPGTAVGDRIVMEDASSIRSTGTFSLNENKGVLLMGTATIGASAGQTLTINSDISGDEGIVEIGGTNAAGVVTLNGANTYLGATTVSSGTLLVNGSLASQQVTISAGAAFGGTGLIAGNIHFDEGALLSISNLEQSFTVDGEISFGGGFGIGSLTGLNWNAVQEGRYTLISTSQDFTGLVSNYGIDNTYWFGNGRGAYFETGSLAMVVIPEPSVAILTGLGALALLRRRRSDS